jgi:hypothetical protein
VLDTLTTLSGDVLDLGAYGEDFHHRFEALTGMQAWKLERLQDFHQPESPSWMRYQAGDIDESFRMLEENRAELVAMFADLEQRNAQVLRVRVVERPLTPYLHWELHSLRIRAQCGERVRVVGPDAVAHLEQAGTLPEVVTLGQDVTYRILYDDAGVLAGCVRHTAPAVTASCREQIRALYQDAEPLESYFTREIAPAEPPARQAPGPPHTNDPCPTAPPQNVTDAPRSLRAPERDGADLPRHVPATAARPPTPSLAGRGGCPSAPLGAPAIRQPLFRMGDG